MKFPYYRITLSCINILEQNELNNHLYKFYSFTLLLYENGMFSKTVSRGPKNRIVQAEHPPNWGLTLLNCFGYRRNSASSLCKLLRNNRNVCTELEENRLQLRPLENRCMLKRVLGTKICAFFMFTGLTINY